MAGCGVHSEVEHQVSVKKVCAKGHVMHKCYRSEFLQLMQIYCVRLLHAIAHVCNISCAW